MSNCFKKCYEYSKEICPEQCPCNNCELTDADKCFTCKDNSPACLKDINLESIFQKQHEFQKQLNINPVLNFEYMNTMFLALFAEIGEALAETAWKNPEYTKYGWKKGQLFNQIKLTEELADCIIFIINICSAARIKSDMLLRCIDKKIDTNIKRQRGSY